jgi:hypothetical protein
MDIEVERVIEAVARRMGRAQRLVQVESGQFA